MENEDDADDQDRVECEECGRKFNNDAFEKHAKICQKVFQSKRKAFDPKKQRVVDSEHAAILKQKEYEEKKKAKLGVKAQNSLGAKNNMKKGSKWKKQSEELRAILKANKTHDGFGVGSIYFINSIK